MHWWQMMLSDEEIADLVQALLPPGGQVLDVGCGSGHTLATLLKRGMAGMGVDPYPHAKGVQCLQARAEEIGRLDQTFGLVYTAYSLHHFDDPRRFMQEARQVLAPGGVLLVVDWVEGTDTGIPERYLAPEAVARWLEEAGFDLVRQERRGSTMVLAGRHAPRYHRRTSGPNQSIAQAPATRNGP